MSNYPKSGTFIAGAYIEHKEKSVADWEASDMPTLLKIVDRAIEEGYVIGKDRMIYPWHQIIYICYRQIDA